MEIALFVSEKFPNLFLSLFGKIITSVSHNFDLQMALVQNASF
jgi:hypothetical protein